jgi:hypothetical protein
MTLLHRLLMVLVLYVAVLCAGLFLANFMGNRKKRRR